MKYHASETSSQSVGTLKNGVGQNALDFRIRVDHYQAILADALMELTAPERRVIFLRYWVPCSIAQVSAELRVSWETADRTIDAAVCKLRASIKRHRLYEKTESDVIAAVKVASSTG